MSKVRRTLGSAAKKIPGAASYLELKRLREKDRLQMAEIANLTESAKNLQARNDQWEAEVRQLRGAPQSLKILWPVAKQDLFQAKFQKTTGSAYKAHKPPYVINWVIPPMGETSGGHTTILRIVRFLESRGFTCRLYFYDPMETTPLKVIQGRLPSYPQVAAEVLYNETDRMQDCDAVFATSWHTAYPVANYKGKAKKFYFVQDFEPFFDPIGSYSTLADNTYHFGLRGLTIGSWLAEKLGQEYGMPCDSFEFGVDTSEYFLTNRARRKKVFFFARPVTPRRGFELGILALERFHQKNPQYEINLFGWDLTPYEIPFPHVSHGILPIPKLNELYNECAAGLVLSLTNMSLLPLEMLASGCVPVLNDAHHTRKVGYGEYLHYSDPTPTALADALEAVVTAKDQTKIAAKAAQHATKFQWSNANEIIEQVLLRELG